MPNYYNPVKLPKKKILTMEIAKLKDFWTVW